MKLLLLGLLVSQAQTVEGRGFEIDPLREGISALGMLSISVFLDREKTQWSGLSACEREKRRLTPEDYERFEAMSDEDGVCEDIPMPFFDHWVVGQNSSLAAKISDYGLISLALAPFAFSAIDIGANTRPAKELGEDALVSLQTMGAALLLVEIIKVAAARPRPLTYNQSFGKEARFTGDSRLSFPSGHSALSFASASLISVMLVDRYGWSAPTMAAVIGLYGVAAGVALMRNLAGKHFVSDVLAGSAIGTLLGLALPIFHLQGDRSPEDALRRPGNRPRPLVSVGFPF